PVLILQKRDHDPGPNEEIRVERCPTGTGQDQQVKSLDFVRRDWPAQVLKFLRLRKGRQGEPHPFLQTHRRSAHLQSGCASKADDLHNNRPITRKPACDDLADFEVRQLGRPRFREWPRRGRRRLQLRSYLLQLSSALGGFVPVAPLCKIQTVIDDVKGGCEDARIEPAFAPLSERKSEPERSMFLRDIECGAVVQGNGISRLSNVLSVRDVVLEVRTDISCIVVGKHAGSPGPHMNSSSFSVYSGAQWRNWQMVDEDDLCRCQCVSVEVKRQARKPREMTVRQAREQANVGRSCASDRIATEQNQEHKPVRDEKQRNDESWNEVRGLQHTRY